MFTKIVETIKRKIVSFQIVTKCNKGKHKWMYYTMGNRLVTIGGVMGFWDIPARHCNYCKREEEKREKEYQVYND